SPPLTCDAILSARRPTGSGHTSRGTTRPAGTTPATTRRSRFCSCDWSAASCGRIRQTSPRSSTTWPGDIRWAGCSTTIRPTGSGRPRPGRGSSGRTCGRSTSDALGRTLMKRDLAGLRVLVTGASQGIGRAIAYHAAIRVMRVMAAARNWDLLLQLKEEVGQNGQTLDIVQADVASPEGREAMVRAVSGTVCGRHVS